MQLNTKFYEILSSTFRVSVAEKICITQTDRHFPKIVKSCLGPPKTYKSIKNRRQKFSRFQYFLLMFI